MKIRCIHGYFIFEETRISQISDFMARYELDLVLRGTYYTFADIEEAPTYSIKGKDLLGNVATVNFEGQPWEVFEENGLVYNFETGLVVPISGVVATTTIEQAGNVFLSPGLILPGSTTVGGQRVKDYSAWFSRDTLRFRYSEVGYV